MIDLSTYHVFWIRDIDNCSYFVLSYDNLCHKISDLSLRLSPNFTIDCYRWDKDSHDRGALCDGVVVLGTDYFKIFHEKNVNTVLDIPCDHCKHGRDKTNCRTHCLVWSKDL